MMILTRMVALVLACSLGLLSITPASVAAERRTSTWARPSLPVGTWYITFLIDGTPPGFHLPAILTFHRDHTFTAVDGGDFGALSDLPFNQASQQGIWRWAGGRQFVAEGLILSFSKEEGTAGALDNVSRTHIEIEFDANNPNEFTAVVSQDFWFCPDTFSCPDPFSDLPDLVVPAEGSGFSILARRLSPK